MLLKPGLENFEHYFNSMWDECNCVVDHNKLENLKRWEYQTTLPGLLRSLYAGQEATVRTRHGTTAWVKIGKGVWRGYVLSPCLLNLHEKECMYMYNWITAIQQKLTQHCKSAIFIDIFKETRKKPKGVSRFTINIYSGYLLSLVFARFFHFKNIILP